MAACEGERHGSTRRAAGTQPRGRPADKRLGGGHDPSRAPEAREHRDPPPRARGMRGERAHLPARPREAAGHDRRRPPQGHVARRAGRARRRRVRGRLGRRRLHRGGGRGAAPPLARRRDPRGRARDTPGAARRPTVRAADRCGRALPRAARAAAVCDGESAAQGPRPAGARSARRARRRGEVRREPRTQEHALDPPPRPARAPRPGRDHPGADAPNPNSFYKLCSRIYQHFPDGSIAGIVQAVRWLEGEMRGRAG